MLHRIEDIKKLIGIDPESIGLSDIDADRLSNDMTPWEQYLLGACLFADAKIDHWGGDIRNPGEKEKSAELILCKAAIVIDHGVIESTEADEISVGGQNGMRVKTRKLSREERGSIVADLINRAEFLVTGQNSTDYAGVQ